MGQDAVLQRKGDRREDSPFGKKLKEYLASKAMKQVAFLKVIDEKIGIKISQEQLTRAIKEDANPSREMLITIIRGLVEISCINSLEEANTFITLVHPQGPLWIKSKTPGEQQLIELLEEKMPAMSAHTSQNDEGVVEEHTIVEKEVSSNDEQLSTLQQEDPSLDVAASQEYVQPEETVSPLRKIEPLVALPGVVLRPPNRKKPFHFIVWGSISLIGVASLLIITLLKNYFPLPFASHHDTNNSCSLIQGGSRPYTGTSSTSNVALTIESNTSDGSMFGFNLQHTRYNTSEHFLSTSNVSQLVPGWSYNTGQPIYSSPTVANGLVYFGSYDHQLYALDALTGKQHWQGDAMGHIESSPAIADGIVYVGSIDGNLYAFDAVTGLQGRVFKTTGHGPVSPGWKRVWSSPAVANGMVYVGSFDNNLYAFDTHTGQPRWIAETNSHIYSSPSIANGIVYVGSYDRRLYAFNAQTGSTLWFSGLTGKPVSSSPSIANGIVYVGSEDGRVYAFHALTGQCLWVSAATGGAIESSPAVVKGIVYVGSDDDKLYAFDALTGDQHWVSKATKDVIFSSPTVANGVIYVGSRDHKLYAFDASTGDILWTSRATDDQIDSSPTVANGVVYVGSLDGTLYTFHLPD